MTSDYIFNGLEEEGAVYTSLGDKTEKGITVIKRYLSLIGDSPGVYRMLDEKGDVLYVGKARSLKNRVSSYTTLQGQPNRIIRMILSTASMIFVTTNSEIEALLLEANLIKKLKPRYNVLLRDDKSFAYILVNSKTPYARLMRHRGAKTDEGTYYGPFASSGAVNRTIKQLQKAFQLRTCSDSYFRNRTRPCLLYQIKRCCAPCVGYVAKEEYDALAQDAQDFLEGKTTKAQKDLAKQMEKASAALNFEHAAACRDRIKALTQIQSHQDINPKKLTDGDVVALHMDRGHSCIQVFFFRSGQNWGNRSYFPRINPDNNTSDVLEAFLGQFYSNKTPPAQILLSHDLNNTDLLTDALSLQARRKVQLIVPQRGEKKRLIDHALQNAQESLARKLSETASQTRFLEEVSEVFELEKPPSRIEVYDNSHVSGQNPVGAMIVAGTEGFIKSQYRKYNIANKALSPGDDFGMMQEVLSRRFKRLMDEDPTQESGSWPDLVIIDGGQGQLTAAQRIFDEFGITNVALIAVSKGSERDKGRELFHRTGYPAKALPHKAPVLYFLQRLRDEAHRFAIGAHRKQRAKSLTQTPLDEIPGIGAARKRALLQHFGSAKAISRASIIDIASVDGISKSVAQRINAFFKEE